MKALTIENLEQIHGGDCSTEVGEAVGLFAAGVLIAATGGAAAIAAGFVLSQAGWWRGLTAPCF